MAEKIGLEAVLDMAGFNRGKGQYLSGIDQMTGKTSGATGILGKLGGALVSVGAMAAKAAVAGIAAATTAVVGLGVQGIRTAIEVESSFAGVIKTTDGLTDEFGELTAEGETMFQGFRDLSKEIPVAVEELMGIGELGGQLGIANDNLLGFVETIAAVGEATNLTQEEAATSFAQIANIMGTPQEQISNMASSVVALGNNFATTERDVVNFAQRIAGAGQIAGLSESEIFGIGAAMSSVGIEAEAGGTAVQKVLLSINEQVLTTGDQLSTFAQTAGMSSDEFALAWEADAGGAFTAFVNGLGTAGDDAMGILADLGLEDQRLIRSFLSLAGAGDLLNDAMAESGAAFEENVALTNEANARYRTTESQIQLLKNTFKDISLSIGQALLPVFNDLLGRFRTFLDEHGPQIEAVFQRLADWLGEKIPLAIDFVSQFWTNVLQPAILSVWSFISDTLLPLFQNDVAPVLQELIPTAIAILSEYWETNLLPALQTVWNFVSSVLVPLWTDVVKPVLDEVIPAALAKLATFWENVLQPAIQAVWSFLNDVVIPFLAETVVPWLAENVPVALETLSDFWENVLQPAIEAVWSWMSTTLIPFLQDTVIPFLQDKIPKAIDLLREYWEEILLPVITRVWEFLSEDMMPIWEALEEFLSVTFTLALTALQGIWENVLLPALTTVYEFIRDNIGPIMEWFKTEVVEPLTGAFDSLGGVIDTVAGWIGTLTDSLKNVKLPDWMTPGSPTPWEIGLRGVADVLSEINETSLPKFKRELTDTVAPLKDLDGLLTGQKAAAAAVRGAHLAAGAEGGRMTRSVFTGGGLRMASGAMAGVAAGGKTITVNMGGITVKNGMDQAEAETWIVGTIRRALNA